MDTNEHQYLIGPVELLTGKHPCWQCNVVTPVYAVFGSEVEEVDEEGTYSFPGPWLLSGVEVLDQRLLQELESRAPLYRYDESFTRGQAVLMNHCVHCGSKIGDWYLHSEPDGCFFAYGRSEHEVQSVEIAPDGRYEFVGGFGG